MNELWQADCELLAANQSERPDFARKIRSGIDGARCRNDEVTRKMLESAMMMIIQQHRVSRHSRSLEKHLARSTRRL